MVVSLGDGLAPRQRKVLLSSPAWDLRRTGDVFWASRAKKIEAVKLERADV